MNINLTMFAQAIAFFVLFWVSKKFLWPPLMEAIETRRAAIAAGLAAAEKGKSALAEGEQQKLLLLKEAREQAGEVKALNEKQALSLIDEAKVQAKVEADRIVAAAHASAANELQKARDALRDQVAMLAIAGAEKILRREVDPKAHADMLSQLKAQL